MAGTSTVLVVDDDADTREMLEHFLRVNGLTVATASSGSEALERLADVRPQVVLMDLAMPQMNGAEAVRRIKANPETRNTAVLVVTAHMLPQHLAVARAAGADAILLKPVDPDVLLSAIRAALPATPHA